MQSLLFYTVAIIAQFGKFKHFLTNAYPFYQYIAIYRIIIYDNSRNTYSKKITMYISYVLLNVVIILIISCV